MQVTIHPKLRPIIVLLIATSLIWGLGLVAIARSPSDYQGYVALALAAAIVGYLGTEKIEIAGGKIKFYRYFVRYAESDLTDVRMVRRRVGKPAIIQGVAFERKSDGRSIAELALGNYKSNDLDELRKILEFGSLGGSTSSGPESVERGHWKQEANVTQAEVVTRRLGSRRPEKLRISTVQLTTSWTAESRANIGVAFGRKDGTVDLSDEP